MRKYIIATRDRVGFDLVIVKAHTAAEAKYRAGMICADNYCQFNMTRPELNQWLDEREWCTVAIRPLAMVEKAYRRQDI